MKARFWTEMGLGALSSVLAVATLVWPEWIELVFGFAPDGGSGQAEWLITALCVIAALVSFAIARLEWRHGKAASVTSGG